MQRDRGRGGSVLAEPRASAKALRPEQTWPVEEQEGAREGSGR